MWDLAHVIKFININVFTDMEEEKDEKLRNTIVKEQIDPDSLVFTFLLSSLSGDIQQTKAV